MDAAGLQPATDGGVGSVGKGEIGTSEVTDQVEAMGLRWGRGNGT
jgi:hypothetical protein